MSTILDDIKSQFRSGSMTTRLIIVNAAVFIFISVANLIMRFASPEISVTIGFYIHSIFDFQTNLKGFLYHPWGLITSIFSHYGLMHFAFNMLMLYAIGRLFEHYLGGKRLLATYLLGGICGNLLELIIQNIDFLHEKMVVGASGAIFALIFAMAAYMPRFQISVFGLFNLNLRALAIILFLFNFFSIGANDGTAHLAHLGGAIFGYFSVRNYSSNKNIVTRFSKWLDRLFTKREKKSKIKITKNPYQSSAAQMSDEEYNTAKKKRQERIDSILDKISKSGYESLTKEEKEFLFKQSK